MAATLSATQKKQIQTWMEGEPRAVTDALWRGLKVAAEQRSDDSALSVALERVAERSGIPEQVLSRVLRSPRLLRQLAPGIEAPPSQFILAWQHRTPASAVAKLWKEAIEGNKFDDSVQGDAISRIANEAGVSRREVHALIPLVKDGQLQIPSAFNKETEAVRVARELAQMGDAVCGDDCRLAVSGDSWRATPEGQKIVLVVDDVKPETKPLYNETLLRLHGAAGKIVERVNKGSDDLKVLFGGSWAGRTNTLLRFTAGDIEVFVNAPKQDKQDAYAEADLNKLAAAVTEYVKSQLAAAAAHKAD